MNTELLKQHVKKYVKRLQKPSPEHLEELAKRIERRHYYQSWTKEKILAMTLEEFEEYIAKLWAMLIWGNKKYVTDKMIDRHGLDHVKQELAELVWGDESIIDRWDRFRGKVTGMGPAMASEILCHVHPKDCMLWNRPAYVGLNYLGVKNLPRYNYQLSGKRYHELTQTTKIIVRELATAGVKDPDLLTADYFIWEELQVESNLNAIFKSETEEAVAMYVDDSGDNVADFIHDEVRDKLKDIGEWLGLESSTEVKVADGSVVDALWQQSIGNMGRVVYVFEVQTKGSKDSLILNLLKSLNNPAVQTVVAVSDKKQIEIIKKHAFGVQGLKDRLRYWEYQKVLQVHEALASVNEEVNSLNLVPNFNWK